jgi:hypothetical protein
MPSIAIAGRPAPTVPRIKQMTPAFFEAGSKMTAQDPFLRARGSAGWERADQQIVAANRAGALHRLVGFLAPYRLRVALTVPGSLLTLPAPLLVHPMIDRAVTTGGLAVMPAYAAALIEVFAAQVAVAVSSMRRMTRRTNRSAGPWIDQGRIVERGTYRELMALGGTYARTYRQQALHLEPVVLSASGPEPRDGGVYQRMPDEAAALSA